MFSNYPKKAVKKRNFLNFLTHRNAPSLYPLACLGGFGKQVI